SGHFGLDLGFVQAGSAFCAIARCLPHHRHHRGLFGSIVHAGASLVADTGTIAKSYVGGFLEGAQGLITGLLNLASLDPSRAAFNIVDKLVTEGPSAAVHAAVGVARKDLHTLVQSGVGLARTLP